MMRVFIFIGNGMICYHILMKACYNDQRFKTLSFLLEGALTILILAHVFSYENMQ